VAFSPDWIARIEESRVDGRVLGFTCLVALLTSLLAGLIPALQASKADVNETLKAQSAAAGKQGGRRAMPAMMIAELALSLVLLAGAGLMIKSFLRLLAVPKGFNPDGVLMLTSRPAWLNIRRSRRNATPITVKFSRASRLCPALSPPGWRL
jgi:putative ABC transport system permease protein